MRSLSTVMLACLLAACSGTPEPVEPQACIATGLLSRGEKLPDCSFEGLPGHGTVRTTTLGSPAVINFWASWCPNCIDEMPDFQRVADALDGRVAFVGLNLLGIQHETRQAAQTFARRTGVRYRLAYDEGGHFYGHFARRTSRPVMPLTVFVDPDGTVKEIRFGQLSERDLRRHVKRSFGL